MNKYELVFIVDSRLSDAEKSDVSKQVTDLVTKVEGKIVNASVWIDRQRMAFPIDKAMEGTYYLFNIEVKGSEVARLRRELLINERVMRFLIIRPEEQKVKA
ncbi:MAG: 30S ribosomal protein S6 [Candidatus Omnitrophica bacterium]|nr:30S ribosomal protein S6 [Candidatus Omnitrophota bacterium]